MAMSKLSRAEQRFEEERDRRYAEVAEARAEALKIKERADEKALDLSAEVQRYKDAKANELREQINEERGEYVTAQVYDQRHEALEAEIKLLSERVTTFIASSLGHSAGTLSVREIVFSALGALLIIGTIISPHIH